MPIRGSGVQESHLYKSQIELKKFCGCELKHLQKNMNQDQLSLFSSYRTLQASVLH